MQICETLAFSTSALRWSTANLSQGSPFFFSANLSCALSPFYAPFVLLLHCNQPKYRSNSPLFTYLSPVKKHA
jgi:hypothetical protein